MGSSIGVELVGLSEAGVDELVRATNNAAMSYAVKDLVEEKRSALVGGQLNAS